MLFSSLEHAVALFVCHSLQMNFHIQSSFISHFSCNWEQMHFHYIAQHLTRFDCADKIIVSLTSNLISARLLVPFFSRSAPQKSSVSGQYRRSEMPSLQWKSNWVVFGMGAMNLIDANDTTVNSMKNKNIDLCRWYLCECVKMLELMWC